MTDLVKLYNPANAASLTAEELAGLQKLESAQLKELAHAYPNSAMQRAYLLIIDKTKPPEKQLPTLSTFENLWNLREKNGMRNHVAYAFKGTYKSVLRSPIKPKRTEVLDLSDIELMSLPGFKTANKEMPAQTVNVTKIKKEEVKLRAIDDPNFVPAKDFNVEEHLLNLTEPELNSLPDYLREDAKELKKKLEKEKSGKVTKAKSKTKSK